MRKLAALLVILLFASCDCADSNLSPTCSVEQIQCWVPRNVENIEANIWKDPEHFPPSANTGACTVGHLACNEDKEIYCAEIVYGEEEICDGFDNDCDGLTDEGFDRDRDGWPSCMGDCDDSDSDVHPMNPELCDGKDNDCNGHIPEDENDEDGDGWRACEDCNDNDKAVAPGLPEICDRKDNNCDLLIDVDTREEQEQCGPGIEEGYCRNDTYVCVAGELYCVDARYPQQETCDGVDNDCDGQVDEEQSRRCETECGIGIETCNAGEWVNCDAPIPQEEICDGFDNDCDGDIDEGCLCVMGTFEFCTGTVDEQGNLLNCGMGVKECLEGGFYGPCVWFTNTEEECNNYDDDCDGVVDGMEEKCGNVGDVAGIGECRDGVTRCEMGIWSSCEGAVEPQDEVCDQKDNDCDGEVDENLNQHDTVDIVFLIDGSGSMCDYIVPLRDGIAMYAADFEDLDHQFALVIFPSSYNPTDGNVPWVVIQNLTDVNTFIASLSAMACNYPANEPSYDAMHDAADWINPMGINWRAESYPYLILMTDEPGGTWKGLTEAQVAQETTDCNVGTCEHGDAFEVFVFTDPGLFSQWDAIVYWENHRLISLQPPSAQEYTSKLRTVFTNVCF